MIFVIFILGALSLNGAFYLLWLQSRLLERRIEKLESFAEDAKIPWARMNQFDQVEKRLNVLWEHHRAASPLHRQDADPNADTFGVKTTVQKF